MTGQQIGTNLTSETIAGYALPGRALANMIFKSYALQGLLSALNFIQGLKLGHYMKIPPRATFYVQVVGAVWAAIVQVGIKSWMFGHIEGLCTEDQAHNFTCPHAGVFYTSSIVWGVIGPDQLVSFLESLCPLVNVTLFIYLPNVSLSFFLQFTLQFGKDRPYNPIYWALLVGVFVPFPTWLLARKYPKSWYKFVSWPLIFTGVSYLPSAAGINYSAWFLAAFVFREFERFEKEVILKDRSLICSSFLYYRIPPKKIQL